MIKASSYNCLISLSDAISRLTDGLPLWCSAWFCGIGLTVGLREFNDLEGTSGTYHYQNSKIPRIDYMLTAQMRTTSETWMINWSSLHWKNAFQCRMDRDTRDIRQGWLLTPEDVRVNPLLPFLLAKVNDIYFANPPLYPPSSAEPKATRRCPGPLLLLSFFSLSFTFLIFPLIISVP